MYAQQYIQQQAQQHAQALPSLCEMRALSPEELSNIPEDPNIILRRFSERGICPPPRQVPLMQVQRGVQQRVRQVILQGIPIPIVPKEQVPEGELLGVLQFVPQGVPTFIPPVPQGVPRVALPGPVPPGQVPQGVPQGVHQGVPPTPIPPVPGGISFSDYIATIPPKDAEELILTFNANLIPKVILAYDNIRVRKNLFHRLPQPKVIEVMNALEDADIPGIMQLMGAHHLYDLHTLSHERLAHIFSKTSAETIQKLQRDEVYALMFACERLTFLSVVDIARPSLMSSILSLDAPRLENAFLSHVSCCAINGIGRLVFVGVVMHRVITLDAFNEIMEGATRCKLCATIFVDCVFCMPPGTLERTPWYQEFVSGIRPTGIKAVTEELLRNQYQTYLNAKNEGLPKKDVLAAWHLYVKLTMLKRSALPCVRGLRCTFLSSDPGYVFPDSVIGEGYKFHETRMHIVDYSAFMTPSTKHYIRGMYEIFQCHGGRPSASLQQSCERIYKIIETSRFERSQVRFRCILNPNNDLTLMFENVCIRDTAFMRNIMLAVDALVQAVSQELQPCTYRLVFNNCVFDVPTGIVLGDMLKGVYFNKSTFHVAMAILQFADSAALNETEILFCRCYLPETDDIRKFFALRTEHGIVPIEVFPANLRIYLTLGLKVMTVLPADSEPAFLKRFRLPDEVHEWLSRA